MERKFSLHYYRQGLSTFTTCDNPLQLLHRLIVLLNDLEVKDIRVSEYHQEDSVLES